MAVSNVEAIVGIVMFSIKISSFSINSSIFPSNSSFSTSKVSCTSVSTSMESLEQGITVALTISVAIPMMSVAATVVFSNTSKKSLTSFKNSPQVKLPPELLRPEFAMISSILSVTLSIAIIVVFTSAISSCVSVICSGMGMGRGAMLGYGYGYGYG